MMSTYRVTIVADVTTESFRNDESEDPIEWDRDELIDTIKKLDHMTIDSIELRTEEERDATSLAHDLASEIGQLKCELAKIGGAK